MNIIRFKQGLIENDTKYNTLFAGKYAIVVRMMYAVPMTYFNDSTKTYAQLEQSTETDVVASIPEDKRIDVRTSTYSSHIDTTFVFDTSSYVAYNANVTNDDNALPIDVVKKLRRDFAQLLLTSYVNNANVTSPFDETQVAMLTYYACDMYDDAIKILSKYSYKSLFAMMSTLPTTTATCACTSNNTSSTSTMYQYMLKQSKTGCTTCNGGTSSTLLASMNATCDPITTYRDAVRYTMLATFGTYAFWTSTVDVECVKFVIARLKRIVEENLPLTSTLTDTGIDACASASSHANIQSKRIAQIESIIKSFTFIVNNDYASHKNAITNDAYVFATLYELFDWA